MNKEILWNLINSLLAGIIFLAGSFTATGHINLESFFLSLMIAIGVAALQFKNYWDAEKPEYCPKLFSFIKL